MPQNSKGGLEMPQVADHDKASAVGTIELDSLSQAMLNRASRNPEAATYTAAYTAYMVPMAAARRYRGHRMVVKVTTSTGTAND